MVQDCYFTETIEFLGAMTCQICSKTWCKLRSINLSILSALMTTLQSTSLRWGFTFPPASWKVIVEKLWLGSSFFVTSYSWYKPVLIEWRSFYLSRRDWSSRGLQRAGDEQGQHSHHDRGRYRHLQRNSVPVTQRLVGRFCLLSNFTWRNWENEPNFETSRSKIRN